MTMMRWVHVPFHISLGLSLHVQGRFSHLSLHLPFGVLVCGFTGEDER